MKRFDKLIPSSTQILRIKALLCRIINFCPVLILLEDIAAYMCVVDSCLYKFYKILGMVQNLRRLGKIDIDTIKIRHECAGKYFSCVCVLGKSEFIKYLYMEGICLSRASNFLHKHFLWYSISLKYIASIAKVYGPRKKIFKNVGNKVNKM